MDILDLILQILTVLILAGYAFILIKSRLNPKVVLRAAIIITLAGTGVFVYGYATEGYQSGWITMFLRGLISSIKMFLYENSVFESLVAQKSSPYFLDAFVLVYYCAMLTSFSAIILLFGKRVVTFFTLLFPGRKFRHVFFGVNKNAEMIAKGIDNEEIAFIEFPDDADGEDISVAGIIKSMTKDDRGSSLMNAPHVTLLRAKRKLANRDTGEGVLEQIGLGRLARRIDDKTSFYLMSDNCERNLQELLILMSDESLRSHTTHACVKREGLAQSFHGVLGKTGAHLVYPSSLSVVDLMRSPDCHPFNLMHINTDEYFNSDATVSGEFNALIIGFGETGQAATKFVYEFASAILPDGSPMPVHIYINDDNLDKVRGHFAFNCPEMEHDSILIYENFQLETEEFWNSLFRKLDTLNFVEISMGSDTENLNLACTIYGYAEKRRKDGFKNFRIYVRKNVTPAYEQRLVQRLNEKAGMEVIRCFGEYDKVYTPAMMVSKDKTGINKSATSLAGKLKIRYEEISGIRAETPDAAAATYHEKRTARKDMHQYISRANHMSTKIALTGWNTDVDEKTLENLAMCEHLRYSRYMRAHGYTFDKEDDDVLKTSHQLVTWAELNEEDRKYHRDMVRASLSVFE